MRALAPRSGCSNNNGQPRASKLFANKIADCAPSGRTHARTRARVDVSAQFHWAGVPGACSLWSMTVFAAQPSPVAEAQIKSTAINSDLAHRRIGGCCAVVVESVLPGLERGRSMFRGQHNSIICQLMNVGMFTSTVRSELFGESMVQLLANVLKGKSTIIECEINILIATDFHCLTLV